MPDKKFKDTKAGKWIKEKLPEVADKFADVIPDRGMMGVIKRVVDGSPELTNTEKLEFDRLTMESEKAAQDNVTRRWEADAKSDVKLAKYIRPATMIALTAFYMVITVWDGIDPSFMPPENYINLLEIIMLTVFGAYFAGRTIEKIKK